MMSAHRPPSFCPYFVRTALRLAIVPLLLGVVLGAQAPDTSQSVEHIRGVVINSIDKRPVPRALVQSNDQRFSALTDTEGRFSFDLRRTPLPGGPALGSVPAGMRRTYVGVQVRRPGYIPGGAMFPVADDPRTLSQEIQVKLVPECVVYGRLSAANGPGPAGVHVLLRRREVQSGMVLWQQAGMATANSRGDYRFADLPAGEYKVMTQAYTEHGDGWVPAPEQSFGYPPAYYADSADLAASPALHVRAGDSVEANLNLRAATLYHVVIPMPGLAKNDGMFISVGHGDEPPGFQMSFNSDHHSVEGYLPNGAYDVRVTAFSQPPSSGRGRVEVANHPVTAASIALSPSGSIPVVVHRQFTASANSQDSGPQVHLQRAFDLFLRSLNADAPAANLRNSQSGNDDSLVLDNVQEGTYRVFARTYRGYVAAISTGSTDLMRQPLVVPPGGLTQPIQITLRDDSASVAGTVTLPPGAQLGPMLLVSCIPLDQPAASPPSQAGAAEGQFTLANLPPGEYLVLASTTPLNNIDFDDPEVRSRYLSHGTSITLAAGQKAEIQVPLLADSGLDGEN